jgi:hypothetical protein
MSEETLRHVRPGSDNEFEHEDLNPRAVFTFLVALAVICIAAAFIVAGMYKYLDAYQREHQPPQNPLVVPKVEKTRPTAAETRAEIKQTFPEPRLEEDERSQLDGFLAQENRELNSYGWVDEKAGVAHIPIDRAMELTVQRGLPVISQNAQAAAAQKPERQGAAANQKPTEGVTTKK